MRLPVPAVFLSAAFACVTVTEGPVDVQVIAEGAYADAEKAQAVVAFDEAAYLNSWAALIGQQQPPEVDFETQSVVFVLGGRRLTGGYAVEVRGAEIQGGRLLLDASVRSPARGSISTQALSFPWAVVAVKSRAFKEVEWNPAGRSATAE